MYPLLSEHSSHPSPLGCHRAPGHNYFYKNLFMYLAALGVNCGTWDLHCSTRDLWLQLVNSWLWHVGPSFLARDWTWAPSALGVQIVSHWTTREVPINYNLAVQIAPRFDPRTSEAGFVRVPIDLEYVLLSGRISCCRPTSSFLCCL